MHRVHQLRTSLSLQLLLLSFHERRLKAARRLRKGKHKILSIALDEMLTFMAVRRKSVEVRDEEPDQPAETKVDSLIKADNNETTSAPHVLDSTATDDSPLPNASAQVPSAEPKTLSQAEMSSPPHVLEPNTPIEADGNPDVEVRLGDRQHPVDVLPQPEVVVLGAADDERLEDTQHRSLVPEIEEVEADNDGLESQAIAESSQAQVEAKDTSALSPELDTTTSTPALLAESEQPAEDPTIDISAVPANDIQVPAAHNSEIVTNIATSDIPDATSQSEPLQPVAEDESKKNLDNLEELKGTVDSETLTNAADEAPSTPLSRKTSKKSGGKDKRKKRYDRRTSLIVSKLNVFFADNRRVFQVKPTTTPLIPRPRW